MNRPRRRSAAGLAALLLAILLTGPGILASGAEAQTGAPADAGGGEPTARLQTIESPGGTVTNDIRLEGWRPGSSVTVSICGNAARRGSQDCDLIGAKGVAIPPGGAVSLAVRLQPPVPCPCVIRVVAANNDLLGSFPIELPGVPTAPLEGQAPAPSGPAGLAVEARLSDEGASIGDRVASWFGLAATRRLVLAVSPQGTTPSGPVSGTATVRQGPTTLQTVAVPAVADARQLDTIEVPVSIPAVAAGEYTVSGQLTTVSGSTRFEATTSNVPWGLVVVALGAVVLVLTLVWRSGRRHGRREAMAARTGPDPQVADPGAAAPSATATPGSPTRPEPLAPSSPPAAEDLPVRVPVGVAPPSVPPGPRRVARRPDERRRRERRANSG